jgi:putative ATP-binding cassette transporter
MTNQTSFWTFLKQVQQIASPYFKSDQKFKAWGLLIAIVALNLGSVYLAVLFNDWYGVFYNALQEKNATVFWKQMVNFSYLAFIAIIGAVFRFYLTQVFEIRWREWMTQHQLKRWLSHQAFYKWELFKNQANQNNTDTRYDNPDQRITEDISGFTSQSVGLTMGLLNSVVTLVSFIGILWGLSGNFSFQIAGQNIVVPGFMVWTAIVYSLVGSLITHYIGRPLIGLNVVQQKVEANFRHHLMRVREYAEAIALDKGETTEYNLSQNKFSMVIANYFAYIKAQKKLIWFTSFFGQAAVIFPFLVAAPRYFSGAIQLGQVIQISSAFGKVQDALSWFVDNYNSLATWRATTNRLIDFELNIELAHQVKSQHQIGTNHALSAHQLEILLPNGQTLLSVDALQLNPGDSVALMGASGSGKSSLLRVLAGIWPFSKGNVAIPENNMFIPQNPYIPNGTLRAALSYPDPEHFYTDEALIDALQQVKLEALQDDLDKEMSWSQQLSGGEQQRLAIARVFLKKPAWIFADEATSALDDTTQQLLYRQLMQLANSQNGGFVSITHQANLAAMHPIQWTIENQLLHVQAASTASV